MYIYIYTYSRPGPLWMDLLGAIGAADSSLFVANPPTHLLRIRSWGGSEDSGGCKTRTEGVIVVSGPRAISVSRTMSLWGSPASRDIGLGQPDPLACRRRAAVQQLEVVFVDTLDDKVAVEDARGVSLDYVVSLRPPTRKITKARSSIVFWSKQVCQWQVQALSQNGTGTAQGPRIQRHPE